MKVVPFKKGPPTAEEMQRRLNDIFADFTQKGPPTAEEMQRRLNDIFADFTQRGANAEDVALLIFTYGTTQLLSYADNPDTGIQKIDDILYNSFGFTKEIVFTPDDE